MISMFVGRGIPVSSSLSAEQSLSVSDIVFWDLFVRGLIHETRKLFFSFRLTGYRIISSASSISVRSWLVVVSSLSVGTSSMLRSSLSTRSCVLLGSSPSAARSFVRFGSSLFAECHASTAGNGSIMDFTIAGSSFLFSNRSFTCLGSSRSVTSLAAVGYLVSTSVIDSVVIAGGFSIRSAVP